MDEIESSTSSLSRTIVGNLILKVNEMLKRPNIEDDLSGALDQYLEKLSEAERYLANGIFNTNFAEAALLLQSSAMLYGKKVDLLWDFILDYQTRMITYEKETAKSAKEVELIAERQNRYKRKRKIKETLLNEEKTSVNKLVNQALAIEDTSFIACDDLHNTWHESHISTNNVNNRVADHYIPIIESSFLINNPVAEAGEVLTTCDKLCINTAVQEISQEFTDFKLHALKEPYLSSSHFYEQDDVLQKYLLHKGISPVDVDKMFVTECRNYFTNYYRQRDVMLLNLSKVLLEKRDMLCPKRCVTRISRLSAEVMQQYLDTSIKRSSSVIPPDSIKRSSSTAPSATDEPSCPHEPEDSAFVDGTDLSFQSSNCEENNNTLQITGDSLLGNGSVGNGGCSESVGAEGVVESASGKADAGSADLDVPFSNVVTIVLRRTREKRKVYEPDEQQPPKRRRVVRLKILVTSSWYVFEKFYTRNYKSQKGEGTVLRIDSDSDSEDNSDEEIPPEVSLITERTPSPKPLTPDRLETTHATEEPTTTTPNASTSIEQNQLTSNRFKEAQESQKRVREWSTFIGDKLKEQRGEVDFDIHQYGSRIMESMELDESRKFGEIVGGNSAGEVARFFLATLQLANTNNIELAGASGGVLANESLELKLLTKERYHEHLDDYMAPSEETFFERLARVQAQNPSVPLHSTPYSGKARKRKVDWGSGEPVASTSGQSTPTVRRRFLHS